MKTPPSLLDLWRETRDGWSPLLISEPVLGAALAHLQEGLSPGAVVLDLGSGRGFLTEALARYGARAVGVDPRTAALAQCRERYPSGRWVAGTAESLPLADASVDALLSVSVLQYTDRERALAECSRVLRPGGRFAVVENLRGSPWARAYRLAKRLNGSGYAPHLQPRAHLAWEGRGRYEAWFGTVRYRPFHLLSPGLLALGAMHRHPREGAGGGLLRAAARAVHHLDAGLLSVPPLRPLAWLLLVYGTR